MIDPCCRDIMRRLDVTYFVETGTDMAATVALVSRWFAEEDPAFGTIVGEVATGARNYNKWNEPYQYPVFENARPSRLQIRSVDLEPQSVRKARSLFAANPNIQFAQQSSEAFLDEMLRSGALADETETLFYLDAHWGKYWPLRDEIKIILRRPKAIIVIDDFAVPGKSDPAKPHGDFGFDIYRGRMLTFAYVRDLFAGRKVRVLYPQSANSDRRGWVVIFHGYSDDKLAFLQTLPLFELSPDDPRHATEQRLPLGAYLDLRNLIRSVVPLPLLRGVLRLLQRPPRAGRGTGSAV